MQLSIIIPAHNEEKRLSPMLEVYLECFIEKYGNDVEFIIVVNGSTDDTDQVAKSFEDLYVHVKAIIEPDQIGKGGAIMRGFALAQGDLVGFVDADGSTPPQAFQDLVENIGDAGIIIASRWLKDSVVSSPQSISRLIASRVFNFLVHIAFRMQISDTQCGAKLMRKETLQVVLPHLGLTQWAFDVDLLFQCKREGYQVIEHATVWNDAKHSRLNIPRASIEMFTAILRLRLLYSPFRWIVKGYDLTCGRFIRSRKLNNVRS